MTTILTIGHSTHSLGEFVRMLQTHGVDAVADVRSSPQSGFNPEFNRDELKNGLAVAGIDYVFLGAELGGRSRWAADYVDGRVDYELLAAKQTFRTGIQRVISGSSQHTIALMCTEKDPLRCHRTLLVGRELERQGCEVVHILADGQLEANYDAMTRLLMTVGLGTPGMFDSREELVEQASRLQSRRIAYVDRATRRQSVVTS
jgi:uncharacterized protein (DUF488 family)